MKITNKAYDIIKWIVVIVIPAVITLYSAKFFVAGYSITWMAAIIGALIYGVIDYILPGEQNY